MYTCKIHNPCVVFAPRTAPFPASTCPTDKTWMAWVSSACVFANFSLGSQSGGWPRCLAQKDNQFSSTTTTTTPMNNIQILPCLATSIKWKRSIALSKSSPGRDNPSQISILSRQRWILKHPTSWCQRLNSSSTVTWPYLTSVDPTSCEASDEFSCQNIFCIYWWHLTSADPFLLSCYTCMSTIKLSPLSDLRQVVQRCKSLKTSNCF